MVSFLSFCAHFKVKLLPWQREAFGRALERVGDHFRYRLVGISVPRGNGKSYAEAAANLWRLVAGAPRCHIVSTALDLDGALVILEHAKTIIRSHPSLHEAITIRANGLYLPENGSRWTIGSREHTSTRGLHADKASFDETGWVRDDEHFASLLAGQASVADPIASVVSTVGRRKSGPLWTIKQLAEGGDPSVFWWWSSENLSPKVTAEFLERQRRILLPVQYAREHQNQWVDAADALTTQADVDAAMDQPRIDLPAGTPMFVGVDLGMIHDPTVIAIGGAVQGRVVITQLVTFQGSRTSPVKIADVEAKIRALAGAHTVSRIRIESWQGISAVQSLAALGLPVELFTPTAKAHAEEWPMLVQALVARTLVLPKHARLREELLNLVVELGPTGVKVIDRGSVHQDHAVAVRMVVAMAAALTGFGTDEDRNRLYDIVLERDEDDEDAADPFWPNVGRVQRDRYGPSF